jgi:prevent-host-death family protein
MIAEASVGPLGHRRRRRPSSSRVLVDRREDGWHTVDNGGLICLHMAMRYVKIAELKDQLSRHLRAVEAGDEVIVTDRQRPIARIVPATPPMPAVEVIEPRREFITVRDRHRPHVDLGVPSISLLLEERGHR